jgi:D-aminopeptidase
MLAFSVANPLYLPAIGEPQPHSVTLEWLNDAHCDALYGPAVEAVEESVLNAMLAAESVPTVKPPGRVLTAIDPAELLEVLRSHGRLAPRGAH